MKLAILDDYQSVTHSFVDWSVVPKLTIVSFNDHVLSEDELISRLSDCDAVMRIRERTIFSRYVLESLPKLRLILATGMRNARSIDLVATDELGVTVCTTDALHQTTIEVTWLLILALFRGFPAEYELLRSGGWQYGVGAGLAGKTLGVLGLGNMGKPVAKIGQCFGMDVVAWSPNLTPERTKPLDVKFVSKQDLFRQSDALTIHLPHTDTTEGLVDAYSISLMKHGAFLINTSRPKLVDEVALIKALETERLGGAGLDVFEIEPLPRGHTYRKLKNVIATPHLGFVTKENYQIFFSQSRENLEAYLKKKPIRIITSKTPFLPDSQVARQMHQS
ncbi:MAG: hypothetical protein CBB68_05690 [Rhodospirillaceae bacterium TMED8]|nr:hydroxyacid dehydrogenase [Magnetovibrio sp.]OUT51120.1 MAG: hypothetical protein CBB68_05690 [Rhodospirillaceae bacterium TMED8]|tara:strand:- start:5305 stop:6306 length:1002 start_codon:yes stop_codon:yes gene_type:complete